MRRRRVDGLMGLSVACEYEWTERNVFFFFFDSCCSLVLGWLFHLATLPLVILSDTFFDETWLMSNEGGWMVWVMCGRFLGWIPLPRCQVRGSRDGDNQWTRWSATAEMACQWMEVLVFLLPLPRVACPMPPPLWRPLRSQGAETRGTTCKSPPSPRAPAVRPHTHALARHPAPVPRRRGVCGGPRRGRWLVAAQGSGRACVWLVASYLIWE